MQDKVSLCFSSSCATSCSVGLAGVVLVMDLWLAGIFANGAAYEIEEERGPLSELFLNTALSSPSRLLFSTLSAPALSRSAWVPRASFLARPCPSTCADFCPALARAPLRCSRKRLHRLRVRCPDFKPALLPQVYVFASAVSSLIVPTNLTSTLEAGGDSGRLTEGGEGAKDAVGSCPRSSTAQTLALTRRTRSKMAPSTQSESAPLLRPSTSSKPSPNADYQSIPAASPPLDELHSPDLEDPLLPPLPAKDELTPEERRKSLWRWIAVWTTVALLVGVLVIEAVREGNAEFDWKGALKKAGGGVRLRSSCLRGRELTRSAGAVGRDGDGDSGAYADAVEDGDEVRSVLVEVGERANCPQLPVSVRRDYGRGDQDASRSRLGSLLPRRGPCSLPGSYRCASTTSAL